MREGDFTLSADGGGSKLAAVMFDDAFHFRAAGYGGPVNGSFSETEKRRQIAAALSPCLSSVPSGGIGRAFLSAPWTGNREEEEDNNLFFLEVKKHSPRVRCSPLSEGEACLLAGQFQKGRNGDTVRNRIRRFPGRTRGSAFGGMGIFIGRFRKRLFYRTKRAAGSHQVGRTMGKGNLSGRTGLSGLWSKTALGSSSCDLWGDLRSKASGVILQIGRKGGRRGR